ncbi:hypothetical protein BVX98_02600 [bacterium F11]|nr:hypothetical protein BVX98_02600 [bacterium F11]
MKKKRKRKKNSISIKSRTFSLIAILGFLLSFVISYSFFYGSLEHQYIYRLPNGLIFFIENPQHAELHRFQKEEGFLSLIQEGESTLTNLSILCKWTSGLFPHASPMRNYPPWNARKILKMIRKGETGGFCAQYAHVFGQAAQSMGHIIRYWDLIQDDLTKSHFVAEVFLPKLGKWVAFDPNHGVYYSHPSGAPLSVLEIRDFRYRKGPSFIYEMPSKKKLRRSDMRIYSHAQYYLRNNHLTQPISLTDKIIDSTRDGKPAQRKVLLFEPYRLLYTDDNTDQKSLSGFLPTITSSNREDFNLKINLNEAKKKWIFGFNSFNLFTDSLLPNEVAHIVIPKKILQTIFDEFLKNYPEYKVLK